MASSEPASGGKDGLLGLVLPRPLDRATRPPLLAKLSTQVRF